MITKSYNGWDSHIRRVRGNKFYAMLKVGKLPAAVKCEVCASTKGLTFHAEQYGSTWDDYIASCHALCCYCHGIIHVRGTYPNRWRRYIHRALTGKLPEFPFTSLNQVFSAFRSQGDLPYYSLPLGLPDHWLRHLRLNTDSEEVKLALVTTPSGLIPDPAIYKGVTTLEGYHYNAESETSTYYQWSKS